MQPSLGASRIGIGNNKTVSGHDGDVRRETAKGLLRFDVAQGRRREDGDTK